MPKRDPEMPHTQTSAPVKSPDTTEDVAPARRSEGERGAERQARDEAAKDERMPRGFDEPGAGI